MWDTPLSNLGASELPHPLLGPRVPSIQLACAQHAKVTSKPPLPPTASGNCRIAAAIAKPPVHPEGPGRQIRQEPATLDTHNKRKQRKDMNSSRRDSKVKPTSHRTAAIQSRLSAPERVPAPGSLSLHFCVLGTLDVVTESIQAVELQSTFNPVGPEPRSLPEMQFKYGRPCMPVPRLMASAV